MSKFPRSVKILGKAYTIAGDKDLIEDGTASGLCKPWKCSIRIGTDADIQQQRDTVLHEVFHAIFSETGLTQDFKDDDDEEKIVRRMATATLAILRENPRLVKFLLEK